MDELSNKDKEYAEYSKERNTIIKTLMKINSKKNVIHYTLTNMMSIDEKSMKQINMT